MIDKFVEIEYENLENIEFIFDTQYKLNIKKNKRNFEFFFNLKKEYEDLVVLASGAYSKERGNLPVFQRSSWCSYIKANTIYFNDPTLYLGNISVGWGYGEQDRWYLEEISDIFKVIIDKLNISRRRVIFYGSSAGGFMSLILGGMVEGAKVIVNNPQIDAVNFKVDFIKKLMSTVNKKLKFEDAVNINKERLNVIEFYRNKKSVPQIFYYQNLAAKEDVEKQMKVFINGVKSIFKELEVSKINMNLYINEAEGHDPMSKVDTIRSINNIVNLYNENEGIKGKEITKDNIFIRINNSKYSEYAAKSMLENKIMLYKIWEPVKLEFPLDWNENPFGDVTWYFYFQSLDIIAHLMNTYEESNNINYLKKSKEIIESWINNNMNRQDDKSCWSGHVVSNRLINMMHFWMYYKSSRIFEVDFEEILIKVMKKHAEFLTISKNYECYNHGIFQNQALIEFTAFFNNFEISNEWFKIAIKRLMIRMNEDFSESGVHKEHSPSYHIRVLELFMSIISFMEYYKLEYPQKMKEKFKLIQDYVVTLSLDDGSIPLLGDSGTGNVLNLFSGKRLESDKLKQLVNEGSHLNVLDRKFYEYKDAGVIIYRNDIEKDRKKLYWIFTSAFHSLIHKHSDDLSITLLYDGVDYLVDGGKYNYQEKNNYRKYFRSTRAHNTITVDGKSYDLSVDNIGKAKIISTEANESYSLVCGKHTLYNGVIIYRYLTQINNGALIIHDKIYSKAKHEYTQTFNLGENISIISEKDNSFTLKNNINESFISIKQYLNYDSFSIDKGNEENIRGWQSKDFNKKIPINHVEFIKKGKSIEFLTILNFSDCNNFILEEKNENNDYIEYLLNNKNNSITINIPKSKVYHINNKYFENKLIINSNELEKFSERDGYSIYRRYIGLTPNKDFWLRKDDISFKRVEANNINNPDMFDIYKNKYIYISLTEKTKNKEFELYY